MVRRFQAGNDPQQGGFAATGGTEQTDQLTLREIQRDIVKGDEIAKALDNVFDLNAHEMTSEAS